MTKGWYANHYIDKHCFSDTFEGFVENILRIYPFGFVTTLYLSVIPFVDHVLRTENLTQGLRRLFHQWGYKFPEEITPTNVTSKSIDTSLSLELRKKLLRTESRIIGTHLCSDSLRSFL